MRSKFKWIYALLVALTMQFSFAQQKTVTGKVTGDDGSLPGATVKIVGTNQAVSTGFDGNYSIKVKEGDVLEASYVGAPTKKMTVGAGNVINFNLVGGKVIDVIVLTAQGQTKSKKKLAVGLQTISQDEIQGKPQSDIARSLQGKVAGAQITNTGGMAGSTSNIVIRGGKTFSGNAQPLFVVDGVPFDASSSDQTGSFNQGAAASSSRFLDLDPANIENITILKSLSASVTYGSQGRNGVVLITTKNGKKNQKLNVDYSSSIYFSEVANLPEFTNKFGNGNNNIHVNGNVGNWGAEFNPNVLVPSIYNQQHLNASFPQYIGALTPYVAVENNVKDFFRQGIAKQNSLILSGGGEKFTYSVSGAYTDEEGIVKYNNVNKLNFGGNFNIDVTDKFKVRTNFTFYNTKYSTPPVSAANGAGAVSIFERLLYIPRNLDLNNLPYQDPITGGSAFYRTDVDNPLWLRENSRTLQNVDRFFGVFEPSYQLSNKLNLAYRIGFDRYTDTQDVYTNKGSVETPFNLGYLRTTVGVNTIIDQSLILKSKSLKIAENLSLDPLVGINLRYDGFKRNGLSSSNQVIFGALEHNYFQTSASVDPFVGDLNIPLLSQNILGTYANLDFGYKDYLFLNLAGRYDKVSFLEKDNNDIFYPSASLSFVPTSAFPSMRSNTLEFLKLRASYGTSAEFPELYRTRNFNSFNPNVFQGPNGVVSGTSPLARAGNPNLTPSLRREFEAGLEVEMFNKRLTLDANYFYNISNNQLVDRDLDPSTGFTTTTINAGRIDNKGIEAILSFSPIRTKDFEWSIRNIFYTYRSEVVDLPDGQERINVSGFGNGIGNFAVEGQPMNAIMGTYALKDNNGNYLINPTNGTIIRSDQAGLPDKIIGDPNPDFTYSVANGFDYKGFSLNVLFEYVKGGDFYSNTIENLLRRGVTKDTEEGRFNSYILNGVYGNPSTGQVILDSNNNPIPNQVQITANGVYFLNTLDANSENIYDATRVRLREASFGYTLPKKWLKKTGLTNVSFQVTGSNLWFKAFNLPKYTNVDPDLISTGQGNGSGLDFQTAPQSRRYGFNLKVNF
jgi:TonB-linked SusC/RagA family outer membrane protein